MVLTSTVPLALLPPLLIQRLKRSEVYSDIIKLVLVMLRKTFHNWEVNLQCKKRWLFVSLSRYKGRILELVVFPSFVSLPEEACSPNYQPREAFYFCKNDAHQPCRPLLHALFIVKTPSLPCFHNTLSATVETMLTPPSFPNKVSTLSIPNHLAIF